MNFLKIKMNSRGTITIPSEIRKELELDDEAYFHIYIDDAAIQLVPVYDLTKHQPWIQKSIFTQTELENTHKHDLENEKRI